MHRLGSFLAPLLPPANLNSWRSAEEPIVSHMRSSPTPSSLFGQPPSLFELSATDTDANIQDQDLDRELKRLYNGQELNSLIMNEAIDDKQEMLMEGQLNARISGNAPILILNLNCAVPALPAPNIHQPNGMHIPKSFSEFVVPVNPSNNAKGGPPPVIHQCLKKVKGRQSLGIALSWVSVVPLQFLLCHLTLIM